MYYAQQTSLHSHLLYSISPKWWSHFFLFIPFFANLTITIKPPPQFRASFSLILCYSPYAAFWILIWFLGCRSFKISICFLEAICKYICVVFIELWPKIFCIYMISTPSSSRYVATEWRNIWGVMWIEIPAWHEYFRIMRRIDCSEKRFPCRFTKKKPLLSISCWFSL